MATKSNDPMLGAVLDGRYEIVSRIARGGMATVYQGTDTRLSRPVAIKVMHEGLGDDQDFATKFDREARAAGKISHPNVVSVFDQGHDFGRPYIVMEYVKGCTMRNVISRDAPLEPVRCLELIDHVLSALTAAHESGLVHRDVKPENILISDRGQLKVADFGLARAITAQTATATQGMLIGTVSYLPPELVTLGKADTRSDVYSTGVVLFEMLTGSKPHTGETPIQVAYAHVHNDVPPPSSRVQAHWQTSRSGIPPYLDALVRAATQRDPERRPKDAREFQAMVRKAFRALSDGVMDDPALTKEFSQGFADLESTAPMAPEEWATPISPNVIAEIEADRPVANDALHASERVAVSPRNRSRTGRSLASVGAGSAGSASTGAINGSLSHGWNLAGQAQTPISPALDGAYDGLEGVYAHSTSTDFEPSQADDEPLTEVPVLPKAPALTRSEKPKRLARTLAALVLVIAVVFGGWWLTIGRVVENPNLVALSQTAAGQAATDAQITIEWTDAFSEDVPAGAVISTDPAPGAKVPRGSSVHAVLSKGPERFDVPKVAGLSRDDAAKTLADAQLAVGSVTDEYSNDVDPGIVLRASKEEGAKERRGAAIDLVMSKGPKPISIASWTGGNIKDAQAALTRAGFKVVVKNAHSKTVPADKVMAQSPEKGVGKRGDTITLTKSLGPEQVEVPEVKGMPLQQATDVMTKAGFKVSTKPGPNFLNLNLVAGSEPGAKAKAPEGSTIVLVIV